jgi:hypothetical protein
VIRRARRSCVGTRYRVRAVRRAGWQARPVRCGDCGKELGLTRIGPRERLSTFGEASDHDAIATAGGFEDDEDVAVQLIEEGAIEVAADNGLWHGEGSCPCRAGSAVPSNCHDVLAYMGVPAQNRTKRQSTNTLERLNKGVKRRAYRVGIFLNEPAIISLTIGHLNAEPFYTTLTDVIVPRTISLRPSSLTTPDTASPQAVRMQSQDGGPRRGELYGLKGS